MSRILPVFLLSILFNIQIIIGQIITVDTSQNITKNAGNDLSPNWSPNSKKLVYQSDRNGNWDIFIYDLEKDTTIQLTFNLRNEQRPLWHPYRKLVVFDRGNDTSQYLYKIDLKSRKISPLFEREINCKQLSIAKDGRIVYFLGYDTSHENWELFSYHFIYDNLNQLTDFKEDGLFFDLSPDGKTICYGYQSFFYPFQRFNIFNWYGDELEKFEAFNSSFATWHPDGLKIYFISDQDNLKGEIYSIWKDGTHLMRLTDDNFRVHDISFSPDGKSMACSVLLKGNYEIIIIPLESF